MIIAALLVSIFTLFSVIGSVTYGKRRITEAVRVANSRLSDYIGKKDDSGNSELDYLVEAVSSKILDDFAVRIEAQRRANASHISRQSNALAEDMLNDQINNASPLIGLFLEQFPTAKKRLLKNPSAVQAIIPAIQKVIGEGGAPPSGSRDNGRESGDFISRLRGGGN